ncbi:lathosterol oxidase-like [Apostichopus japonicus]|uniref:lathosterol oxidase-like n=1 Tax=Stichopus japonicus TaxID=307972 RepID=UPI003AB5155C
MDLVLHQFDEHLLTPYVYPETWLEDDIIRQALSLFVITLIGADLMYLLLASFSYVFIFDKRLTKHPRFLENQIWIEIKATLRAAPYTTMLTVVMFLIHIRGYGRLYDRIEEAPFGYWSVPLEVVTFLLFTDSCIYWIHRGLHHRLVYSTLHKPHHAYKITTPFASHAFHPIDGFSQSLPYHLYPLLFPMHKYLYLTFFVMVNFWTVSIHDGDFRVPEFMKPFVNGSAHHTDHHLYYNYNYGQFFTLWDRIGGSFRDPSSYSGEGPMDQVLNSEKLEDFMNKKQDFIEEKISLTAGYKRQDSKVARRR